MKENDVSSGISRLPIVPGVSATSTVTSTGQDITTFDGIMDVVLNSGAGTGTLPTLDVKLQESATVGGSYTDIPGAVFTQVTTAASLQGLALTKEGRLGFVRAVGTITGSATPTFPFSVTLSGRKNRL